MEIINSLTNQIMYIISEIGYIAVVIITAMEYACFPAMPSEVILPAIGILAAKYNKKTFILFSVMGIIIWNAILVSLGYFIGHNWSYIHLIMKQYSIFAAIIIFIIILLLIYRKLVSRKQNNKSKNLI